MKADGPRIGLHSAALGKRNGVNAILGSRPDGGDEKEEEEEEEEAEEEGWRREGIGKIMKSVGLVRVGKRTLLERRFRLLDEVSVACMHGPSVKKTKQTDVVILRSFHTSQYCSIGTKGRTNWTD